MSKEFKIIVAEDDNAVISISVSSTGWNDFEIEGIKARLLSYVDGALKREEENEGLGDNV